MNKSKTEWRLRRGLPVRCIVIAERMAMVRSKGCAAFLIDERVWHALPLCDVNGDLLP